MLVFFEIIRMARKACGSVGKGGVALACVIFLGVAAYSLDTFFYLFFDLLDYKPLVQLLSFVLVSISLTLYVYRAKAGDQGQVTFLLWICAGCVISLGLLTAYIPAILANEAFFVIPLTAVICNDVFAYLWGVLFGRHPLISVSPSKTVEGFAGAAVTTVILVPLAAPHIMQYYDFDGFSPRLTTLYSVTLATWVSAVGPTGGFLASMVKRAAGIKDFSNLIPGHGGVLDRLDCQIMCALFNRLLISVLI